MTRRVDREPRELPGLQALGVQMLVILANVYPIVYLLLGLSSSADSDRIAKTIWITYLVAAVVWTAQSLWGTHLIGVRLAWVDRQARRSPPHADLTPTQQRLLDEFVAALHDDR